MSMHMDSLLGFLFRAFSKSFWRLLFSSILEHLSAFVGSKRAPTYTDTLHFFFFVYIPVVVLIMHTYLDTA